MTATIAQLAARALRKLGVALVADASRQTAAAPVNSATIAARALRELGVPVAIGDRFGASAPIGLSEIAARALRAVGIDPATLTDGTLSGNIYSYSQVATAALIKLAVIAPDETPSAADQNEADLRAASVHDTLASVDYITWDAAHIPQQVFDYYIIMTANLLAPQFGKPASMEAFTQAQALIRTTAISGPYAQAIAEAKVQAVHEELNASGVVSWPVTAVPPAYVEQYVQMAEVLLFPIYRPEAAADKQANEASYSAAMEAVRRTSQIVVAQTQSVARVLAVHEELNAMSLVTWTADMIPASMADGYTTMTAVALATEMGKPFDAAAYTANAARIRMLAMGGAAGQALAVQKIQAVHYSLDARGLTRWTLYDLPDYAEEPYVMMAASLLAPEVDAKADPGWMIGAEMELQRIVSLPSAHQPVRGAYF